MAGRTWLAVILCCLVWFGYTKWFLPPMPQQTPVVIEGTAPQAGTPATSTPAASGPEGLFTQVPKEESNFKTGNRDFQLDFSDWGGRVSRVQLSQYHETVKKGSPGITLVSKEAAPYALSALFSDYDLKDFSDGLYLRSEEPNTVHYHRAKSGILVEKTYKWDASGYLIDGLIRIRFPEGKRREWGHLNLPVGGHSLHVDASNPLKHWEVAALQDDKVTRRNVDKLKKETEILQGSTAWLAYGNRYFTTVLINNSALNPDVAFQSDTGFTGGYLRYPLVLKDNQQDITIQFKMFLGPKEYSEISKVPALKSLIDYGYFSFFAYPLLVLLKFLNSFIHNYGFAIVALTLIVRGLFYPLSVKSYKSMKAMQKLQPQIQALKEKHGDDREKFTREQMALFKTHKVNPAGGCVPMLVQMPVFFALYSVLGNSIDLFHAPFFGWVQDLSAKDPYYIFPVLMGLSMFVQQKMTPTAGMDPTQAKMMLIMPVMFSFMMLNLPSGLTIYMFVSTLLGILQQYVNSRDPADAKPKVVAVTASSPDKG